MITLGTGVGGGSIDVLTLLVKCGLAASKGEARRLVQQGTGCVTGLFGLLLAMDQLGQLKGQDLLCLVDFSVLPGIHFVNLLQRQERQHTNALHDMSV